MRIMGTVSRPRLLLCSSTKGWDPQLAEGFSAKKLAAAIALVSLPYSRAEARRLRSGQLPGVSLDYMLRCAQDVLGHLLDAIGFERGILLGHSDGATIAWYAASVSDQRIRGLCLIALTFFTEDKGLAAIAEAKPLTNGELKARLAKYHNHVDVAFKGWE